jgi:bifunctional non-homologous end joining protein LigD
VTEWFVAHVETAATGDLSAYLKRRNFSRTPEPEAADRSAGILGTGPSFVVQKHAARNLHYDFRLEHGGVLKSWAVPKGPSLDPTQKRLAVEVEDHPLAYGGFEGTIPEGEYGGGSVLLWDRGWWEPQGNVDEDLRRGRLSFVLHGEKLRGAWSLVRMADRGGSAKPQWLLTKRQDDQARPGADILVERPESVTSGRAIGEIGAGSPTWSSNRMVTIAKGAPRKESRKPAGIGRLAPISRDVEPQLPTLVAQPPSGPDWLHEIKLDGYRVLALRDGSRVELRTRSAQDWADRCPHIADAVRDLPLTEALLDGEIVRTDASGRTSFQSLQRALREHRQAELSLVVFDLLHLDGRDLRELPLERRKEALRSLDLREASGGVLSFGDHVEGDGSRVLSHACELAAEGIVSKRRIAPYRGGRSLDWQKTKCLAEQEFVIVGYTDSTRGRAGFGALLLGVHEDAELRFAGRVGTGFDAATLKDLGARLARLGRVTPPVVNPPRGAEARGVHWVKPQLVAQVRVTEWTADGRLRHPSFQGLREDKASRKVKRERPAEPVEDEPKRSAPRRTARGEGSAGASRATEVAGVRLTNPDRVLFAAMGVTKRDLARHQEIVAPLLLPHLAGRPVALVRCPRGADQECFFQKHFKETMPAGLHPIDASTPAKQEPPYVIVDDRTGLVGLAQIGVLEIHPWGSTEVDLDRPDRLVFDLDPAVDVPWRTVADAAKELRARLDVFGLRAFLKSTGGKGLHLVVPVVPDATWEQAKAFAHWVVASLAAEEPATYLIQASKKARAGRIYLDYLRNARGATAIAPYSPRARSGATVGVPLAWPALENKKAPVAPSITDFPAWLNDRVADPWMDFFHSPPSLIRAVERAAS